MNSGSAMTGEAVRGLVGSGVGTLGATGDGVSSGSPIGVMPLPSQSFPHGIS